MDPNKEELRPVELESETTRLVEESLIDEPRNVVPVEEEGKKKKTVLIVILVLLLLALVGTASWAYFGNKNNGKNYKGDLNVKDSNGVCILNCDTNGDGTCDYNCDTNGDGNPDLNVDWNGNKVPTFNVDTDGDGKPDKNLINQDKDGDGKCDLNCDTNGDGRPDTNIDPNGDGKCSVNCVDENGKCVLNCDTNGDGKCDTNCDTNGDGKCDINCDTTGDGKCDINCDTNGDGKCDINCDTTGDGKCNLNCDTNGDGTCDLNCDTTGDGKCDVYCDTNGDGKCDKNCNPGEKPNTEIEDVIIGSNDKEYVIDVTNNNSFKNYDIEPGWKGTKKFNIKNIKGSSLTYSIVWQNVQNTYTTTNNLYYTVKRNGTTIVNNARVPYNETNLVTNVTLSKDSTHSYEIIFEFKNTSVNQDIDRGKIFKGDLKINLN